MKFKEFVQPLKSRPFHKRLETICDDKQFSLEEIGSGLKVVTVNPKANKALVIVAGVHGDEVAGPLAVLQFLDSVKVPSSLRLIAIPLANPVGFDRGTRENKDRMNINRQFRSLRPSGEAGAICDFLSGTRAEFFHSLHEDDTANGFSLYYQHKSIKPWCLEILKIAQRHMPLDSRKNIHGDQAEREGLIFVTEKRAREESVHKDSLEGWMFRRGIKYICTETSAKLPLQKRVDCQYDIMKWLVHRTWS